ncbi:MAG: protein kinase [Chlamydiia bacterium]|nr:protein kinase [Chlamydiia bacterium]
MSIEGIREGGCIPPWEYNKEKIEDYTLIHEIGKGEKATVYLALDPFGKQFAIKVYQKRFIELARREEELGKLLQHPNIAKIYAVHDSAVVMEYVEPMGQKHLSRVHAYQAALGLVKGLLYATQQGYIHRDLYSSNLIVTREGIGKLVDIDSFALMNEDLYDPLEVDSEGNPMDPLEGYLDCMAWVIEDVLALGGIKEDLRALIPAGLERNICLEDQAIIAFYLEQVKKHLHAAEGSGLFMLELAALRA